MVLDYKSVKYENVITGAIKCKGGKTKVRKQGVRSLHLIFETAK